MIPKKIYYVWLGGKSLPKSVKENIRSWRKYNSDYQIIRIDEKNYDMNKYKFVSKAYDEGQWAFASDLVRLDIIYTFGGFYFDTDVRLLKSLDQFRNKNSVWGLETTNNINSGLILAADRENKDIENIIKIYNSLDFNIKKINEMITTGIISKYFIDKGLEPVNKLQIISDNAYIYPSDYFAPYHWWGGGRVTKNTVAIQQYTKNWGVTEKISNRRKLRLNVRHYFPRLYTFIQKSRH